MQADGSTDAGNVEDELFLLLYYDQHAKDGKVHVHDRFFTVRQPKSGNAEELLDCFTVLKEGLGATLFLL